MRIGDNRWWILYFLSVSIFTIMLVWTFKPYGPALGTLGNDPATIFSKYLGDVAYGMGWSMPLVPLVYILTRRKGITPSTPAQHICAALWGVAIGMHMLPAALNHISTHPYDWGIYWRAGHNQIPFSEETGYWVYNLKVRSIFNWVRPLDYIQAWSIWYGAIVASISALIYLLVMKTRWRTAGIVAALWYTIPVTGHLRWGNIHPILLLLSIHPVGAVVATAIKPYFAVFILLHAWIYFRRKRGAG